MTRIEGIRNVEVVGTHGLRMWYNGDRDVVKTVVWGERDTRMGINGNSFRKEFHGGGFRQVIR